MKLSMENQIQTQTPSTKFCLLVCLFGRTFGVGRSVGWLVSSARSCFGCRNGCVHIVCCMLVSFFALRTAKPLNDELCCFGSMLKQLNHVYYKFKVHMKLLERCNISYYRFAWHRIEIEFGWVCSLAGGLSWLYSNVRSK